MDGEAVGGVVEHTHADAAAMTFHPQPKAGPAVPWDFPTPVRSVLPNGLTVLRCHRPGQKLVAVEAVLDAPLSMEPEGLDGVAMIMARALSEGTDKHSAEEFAAELERCGATLDTQVDHPGIRVAVDVPASRLVRALDLFAEALTSPVFPSGEVERLVANRLDEIAHELASPSHRAAKALYADLFDTGERLSRARQGTRETVARIDTTAVRAFYAAHVHPSAVTLVVVGDLTGIDLEAALVGTLGSWAKGQARPCTMPAFQADDTGRVLIVDRPGAVQTQVLIGRAGPDRHDVVWPAQLVGIHCLGGTITSRLDQVLREEKGYTYGMRAFSEVLFSAAEGTGVSLLGISGSVATEVTGPALEDIWTVLRTLAAEGLTDEEVAAAVQNLVGVAPLRYETAMSVAGTFASQVEQHLPDDYQTRMYARLAEIGSVEATAAVASAFPQDRLVTVLVGDASAIAAPVRELGIGSVTVLTST